VWTALASALGITADDNVIVGLSEFGARNFMESLPVSTLQLVIGHGQDGADRALIGAVDPEHVATRFDSVAIASGDHIFSGLAWRLRALGLLVCNVTTGASGPSRALARACQCHARLKVDVRDRALLARLAATRVAGHGYEGQWIGRHVSD
jgi:hypothetical protein